MYSCCNSHISPSKTSVAGKFFLINCARDGRISAAAKTGIAHPHSTPTSPTPPPEKRDPETRTERVVRKVFMPIF
jgi:hypothetical protein